MQIFEIYVIMTLLIYKKRPSNAKVGGLFLSFSKLILRNFQNMKLLP